LKRLAVIDIGTNSILYLVAEMNQENKVIAVDQAVRAVRLGRNCESKGIIENESLNIAIQVLKEFNRKSVDQKADQIIAVGTRVFRAAKNREQICETIRNETNFNVEVLSEQEEARYSYLGAIYERRLDQSVLAVDIGGGSTEFICGKGNQIEDSISINLGAVNLTERYVDHDPPLEREINQLEEAVHMALKGKIFALLKKGTQLIASGGTATTLGALQLQLDRYDSDRVDGCKLSLQNLKDLIDQLIIVPLEQREKMVRFDPARADIIVAGSIIFKTVLSAGKFEEAMISDRGLRFGIALRTFQLDQLHHP
jgi:exopolyphosphatase/guanosine-5'-triphosphate,3'-diphosphate pyrophosphatase